MSFKKEDWEQAKKAWENIKKQALIDLEQSELYIKAIDENIKKFLETKSI